MLDTLRYTIVSLPTSCLKRKDENIQKYNLLFLADRNMTSQPERRIYTKGLCGSAV
jgi:hypothetical protein